jgi:D-alanyl-lipoteichoic acid acyltransferase DltB (MBOAT superfamily)
LKDYLYIPLGGNRKGKFRTQVNLMTTMLLGGLWHGASWNFVIWGGLNGVGILLYKWWRNVKKLPRTISSAIVFAGFIALQYYYPRPIFMIGVVWSGTFFFGIFIDWIHRNCFKFRPIHWLERCWCIFQTFIFISFTRLFFRSGSNLDPAEANATAWNTAKKMVGQIGGTWNVEAIPDIISTYASVFILFVVGMIIHWLPAKWKQWYRIQFAYLPVWVMMLICVAAVFVVYQFVTAEMQPFIYFQF